MDPSSAVHELEYQQIHQLSMLSTTNLPGQCSNFLVVMLKHAWSIPPMIILSLYLMILCTRHAIKSHRQSKSLRWWDVCSFVLYILSFWALRGSSRCQLEVESLRSMTPNRVFTSNHGKTCRSLGVSNMASGSSVEVIRKSTWARPSKTLPGHYKLPTSSNRHLTSDKMCTSSWRGDQWWVRWIALRISTLFNSSALALRMLVG